MKPIPLLILTSVVCFAPVFSQDAKDSLPAETAATPTAARMLGSSPDGTPPPPEPPKPKFIVPAKDVLESKSIQQGGRRAGRRCNFKTSYYYEFGDSRTSACG